MSKKKGEKICIHEDAPITPNEQSVRQIDRSTARGVLRESASSRRGRTSRSSLTHIPPPFVSSLHSSPLWPPPLPPLSPPPPAPHPRRLQIMDEVVAKMGDRMTALGVTNNTVIRFIRGTPKHINALLGCMRTSAAD